MPKRDKLNAKQEMFAKEYAISGNATQAAEKAGYSPKTCYSQGWRLLRDVEIQAAIAKERSKQIERVEITVDTILRGLHVEATGTGIDTTPSARVNAWTQLAKVSGLITDKLDLNVRSREAAAQTLSKILGVPEKELLQ